MGKIREEGMEEETRGERDTVRAVFLSLTGS